MQRSRTTSYTLHAARVVQVKDQLAVVEHVDLRAARFKGVDQQLLLHAHARHQHRQCASFITSCRNESTRAVTVAVVPSPPRSGVSGPSSSARRMAAPTRRDQSCSPKCASSIAAARNGRQRVGDAAARRCRAPSRAPAQRCAASAPMLPEGASPSPPTSAAASSERISPNRLVVTSDVKALRVGDQAHGRGVHQHLVHLQGGELGGHLKGHRRGTGRRWRAARWPCARWSGGRAAACASSQASRTMRSEPRRVMTRSVMAVSPSRARARSRAPRCSRARSAGRCPAASRRRAASCTGRRLAYRSSCAAQGHDGAAVARHRAERRRDRAKERRVGSAHAASVSSGSAVPRALEGVPARLGGGEARTAGRWPPAPGGAAGTTSLADAVARDQADAVRVMRPRPAAGGRGLR